HVHDGISGDVARTPRREDERSVRRVNRWQLLRRDAHSEEDRLRWRGCRARVQNEWCGAGEEIVVPQIGNQGSDTASGQQLRLCGGVPPESGPRTESVLV